MPEMPALQKNKKMLQKYEASQPVEKVRRKLGFFAFLQYNIGEGLHDSGDICKSDHV